MNPQRTALGLLLALNCVLIASSTRAQDRGKIHDESLPSKFLGSARTIHIYLPAAYEVEPSRKFPVLYLHDGQNVFSTAGTNVAFGWGNWELDVTADRLVREGKMYPIIMVGIDNSGAGRITEYSGHHAASTNQSASFNDYSSFLMRELKPHIDSRYRTLPDAAHTGVMGSSLGGLCSAILAWEHPDVFGNAASLSGSFFFDEQHFLETLKAYKGEPKPVKYYFDSGSMDFTGGDDGRGLTGQVVAELRRIGWSSNDLLHHVDEHPMNVQELAASGLRHDKWKEAQTSQHNEFYWRTRAWRSLEFLFPPEK